MRKVTQAMTRHMYTLLLSSSLKARAPDRGWESTQVPASWWRAFQRYFSSQDKACHSPSLRNADPILI